MMEIGGHVNSHKLFIFEIRPRRAEFQKYKLKFVFVNMAVSSCHSNGN